jgi:hypothetical protein
MISQKEALQERDWKSLHDRMTETLDRFGKKDPFGKGDYWLVDDNWGQYRHQLEIQNLLLFRPHVIRSLQALLAEYPNWRITVQVAVPGKEEEWPGMGIIVYHDKIVDELQRSYLPPEFREITYEGSRRAFDRD